MTYDVHLEIFEGPLDLLLHLIKKNDLEVAEIPIAQITSEYLSYLEIMKELNLEIAGEFLVMAATLMQIKARSMLPKEEGIEEEDEELRDLRDKLLEYQKYKEVGRFLSFKENEFTGIYYRHPPVFDKDEYTLEVSLFDLINGFREVLKELPKELKEIVYKEIPIEQKIREILDMLEGKEHVTLMDIFRKETTRQHLIVSFLAILELIRLKQIIARQSELFEEIRVYRLTERTEEKAEDKQEPGSDNAQGNADAGGAENAEGEEINTDQGR
ncbi:MAG: segregation/condensation protein A [Endomicrobiales bacterium]|nr:segregation/condensation protein A [Endomicrobiales bacterium]